MQILSQQCVIKWLIVLINEEKCEYPSVLKTEMAKALVFLASFVFVYQLRNVFNWEYRYHIGSVYESRKISWSWHISIYFHIPAAQTSVYIGILRIARTHSSKYEIHVNNFHDVTVFFFFHFRFQFQLTRFLWNTRERNSEWHIHLAIRFEWYSWKQQVIDTVLVICPKTYRSIQMKATLQSTANVFIYNLWLCAWIGWLGVIKTKRKINKLTGNLLNQQIPLSTTTLFNDKCKQKCATLMSIWAFYAVKSETQNPFSSILLCVIRIFWKMCIASFCSSFWRSFHLFLDRFRNNYLNLHAQMIDKRKICANIGS